MLRTIFQTRLGTRQCRYLGTLRPYQRTSSMKRSKKKRKMQSRSTKRNSSRNKSKIGAAAAHRKNQTGHGQILKTTSARGTKPTVPNRPKGRPPTDPVKLRA